MSSIYLDWAATAPPDPAVQEQVEKIARTFYGNPSAVHGPGREAGKVLNDCRRRLAGLLSCDSSELAFTSGATESNNMVLFSLLQKKKDRRIIVSGIEHPSIYEPAQTLGRLGFEVVSLAADSAGRIDPHDVASALDDRTALVAVMLVNNETGTIQPVGEITAAVREFQRRRGKRILVHTDAVQAFGKIPFDPYELGVDSAALSAHKIGGPRGVGALFIRRGRMQQFLFSGGGQEHGVRPGTENLPGIYGFLVAAEKAAGAAPENRSRAREAMGALIARLESIPEAVVLPPGRSADRWEAVSPYILNFSVPPIPGEVMVRVLEEEGFVVSTGSACSSRKKDRFRVLENMGVPRRTAFSAVRVSIGPEVSGEPLCALAATLERKIPELLRAIPD